jgi:hypothetical protein
MRLLLWLVRLLLSGSDGELERPPDRRSDPISRSDQGERDKALLAIRIEEFRTRWQELSALQVELNRWRSLYLLAVSGGLAFLLQQQDNAVCLLHRHFVVTLALSVMNSAIALWVALYASWIHQIGRYCYAVVGADLSRLAGRQVLTWDQWRTERDEEPVQQYRKVLDFVLNTGLFAAVSGCLLLAAATSQFNHWWATIGVAVLDGVLIQRGFHLGALGRTAWTKSGRQP